MSILDNIMEDSNPLNITLDFSQFQDGAKLSTKVREYFESKAAEITGLTLEQFFANVLMDALKSQMKKELRSSVQQQQSQAITQIAASREALEQQIDSLIAEKV